jgi:prophage antirepressor-like protein
MEMPDAALQPDIEILRSLTFIRHKRQLRALLLDNEPWFAVSDLSRLINHPHLADRVERNLDADQLQRAWLRNGHGEFQQELMVSESGVYALLIHYFHPENRCIRQWINHDVIPRLRGDERFDAQRPQHARLHWLGQELEVLHWQGKAWLPLGDCPRLLQWPPRVISA